MPSSRPSNAKYAYQARATHFISHLRVPFDIHERESLTKNPLGVYEFDPKPDRQFWTYITSGMSEKEQRSSSKGDIFTELLFYTRERSLWAVELLIQLSTYPFEYDEPFVSGDTLPLAGSIRPNSKLTSLLLTEPLLEHPAFHLLYIGNKKIEILWVLPITDSERELIITREGFNVGKWVSRDRLPDFLDLNRDAIGI